MGGKREKGQTPATKTKEEHVSLTWKCQHFLRAQDGLKESRTVEKKLDLFRSVYIQL